MALSAGASGALPRKRSCLRRADQRGIRRAATTSLRRKHRQKSSRAGEGWRAKKFLKIFFGKGLSR
jgi:hypothetical protein